MLLDTVPRALVLDLVLTVPSSVFGLLYSCGVDKSTRAPGGRIHRMYCNLYTDCTLTPCTGEDRGIRFYCTLSL